MATDIRTTEVEYPTSDGKPMAESDWHYRLLVDVRERLAARYADRPDVYVSGNLMVYYEEGKPQVFLAPDGLVVFGVPNRLRPWYKTWEEGRYPDVVFEFTSKSTKKDDLGRKFRVYQDVWKVKEYFLFDPLAEYLKPSLQGYRLVRGKFAPLKPSNGSLTSRMLDITLTADGARLVMRDAATGRELLTEAQQRAAVAEAENARLRAELAALRRKPTK